MMKKHGVLVAVVVIAVVATSLLFLFRTEKGIRPPFGQFYIRYKWGKPVELIVDRNQDGEADYKDLLPGSFHNHTRPIESWVDLDLDGSFEYHIYWGSTAINGINRIEIDRDADGIPDEVLVDEPANQAWPEIKAVLNKTTVVRE